MQQLELFDRLSDDKPQWYTEIEKLCISCDIHEFQAGVLYSYKDLPRIVRQQRFNIFDGSAFIKNSILLYSNKHNDINKLIQEYDVYTTERINFLPPPKSV